MADGGAFVCHRPSIHRRLTVVASLFRRCSFAYALAAPFGDGIGSLHLRLQSFTLRCAPVHFFRLRLRSPMDNPPPAGGEARKRLILGNGKMLAHQTITMVRSYRIVWILFHKRRTLSRIGVRFSPISFTRASFVKPCIFDFFKFTGLWWKIDDSSHFPALLASILYEWVRFQIRVAEIYFASML